MKKSDVNFNKDMSSEKCEVNCENSDMILDGINVDLCDDKVDQGANRMSIYSVIYLVMKILMNWMAIQKFLMMILAMTTK